MKTLLAAFALALVASFSHAQDKPKPVHPKVDQQKVDEAIQKGCQLLLGAGGESFAHGQRNQPVATQAYAELVLLTLAHSGYYKDGDPLIQPRVDALLTKQIGSTYTASLGAMALQKLNARKYQARIAEYAQFLCDNQAQNGQWDYGEPDPFDPKKDMPATPTTAGQKKRDDVATSGGDPNNPGGAPAGAAPKSGKDVGKTAALPRIPIRKKKPGPPNGDNSNSQYAALGLRACLDAGIDVDPQVLGLARKWWYGSQNSDGGWGYNDKGDKGGGDNPESVSNTSYGSMTVGAVGAICIYDYYLGTAYKSDGSVNRGVEWIVKNYDVTKNPKKNNFAFLYYLYGLERAGILYGTERFGANEWYPDGANHLLSIQGPGGGWSTTDKIAGGPRDTCFAILFLRRGTLPLKPVATGGGPNPNLPAGQVVANGPGGNLDPGLEVKKAVDSFAPGWRLLNNGKGPNNDKLVEARGKAGVFTTYPPNLTSAPTFRKEVPVAAGAKTFLKVVAGHHEAGSWTLIVRVDGKDVVTKPVGPDTAKDGWIEVALDLSAHGGKTVLIELADVAGGKGMELAYWAEIAIRDQ